MKFFRFSPYCSRDKRPGNSPFFGLNAGRARHYKGGVGRTEKRPFAAIPNSHPTGPDQHPVMQPISRCRSDGSPLRAALVTACRTLLLFTAIQLSAACQSEPNVIEIDPRFSYNVVKVPSWFPPADQELTPAETEVMQRWGPPDYMRFWWRPDGEFIMSSDFSGKQDQVVTMMTDAMRTWIYHREKREVEFLPNGGYREFPVSTQLDYICKYGDPEHKSVPRVDSAGRKRETWRWAEYGEMVEFLDGEVVHTSYFERTGSGTQLLK